MSSPVELIKERLSVVDVVGSYVHLEKAGTNMKAKCPFHNERTPSFFVSPARGSYYCFGCGAKGDIFSFVQAFEGLDFVGALKTLASRAGVEVVNEDPRTKTERERLLALLDAATLFFQKHLSEHKEGQAYLAKRGLSQESRDSWRIGFAPDEWHASSEFLLSKGFTKDEIAKAGISKTDNGKTYDRFRSRIMFPIFDAAGRTVAFSGRILGKEDIHTPKYLNSPETPIFSKSKILYGFDRAKTEIRRLDYALLVEGQMDLLMCHQAGFKNTVASSGTAFTHEQLLSLKRLSQRVLMVYDADKAGVQASLRSASLALGAGMEVKVAALPTGTDPAELILEDVEKFKQALRVSTHIIDFYLRALLAEKLDERARARAVRDRLLPYVAALESSIEQDHFIHRIAEETGIRDAAIREDLAKVAVKKQEKAREEEVEAPLSPRRHMVGRLLFGLLFWQERSGAKLLDPKKLEEEVVRILGNRFAELSGEAKKSEDELIYQAEAYYSGHETLEPSVRELLLTLEEDRMRDELTSCMKELAVAEKAKDSVKRNELLTRYQGLNKKLSELKEERRGL